MLAFRGVRSLLLGAALCSIPMTLRAQSGVPDGGTAWSFPTETPAAIPGVPESAPSGLAEAPPPREDAHHLLETRIQAEAPTSAASAETIRDRDLALRPKATPEDILRVVPGLTLAQHQGGGKADQLFLRGFDADHGTDVAVFIDGVPINMPSHGHGQGY